MPIQSPKLLDRLRMEVHRRGYSPRTAEAYAYWCRRFILFHDKRHPSDMADREVNAFLTHLAVRERVAPNTQNQAIAGILFLYRNVLGTEPAWTLDLQRAKSPDRLPVVLSSVEVQALLDQLTGVSLLQASLLYGAGLRPRECCALRVQDLDFQQGAITVRSGKGAKDRVTLFPASLRPALADHLDAVRAQHQRDLDRGWGYVALPAALERKKPQAARSWPWQWVFPATRTYLHVGRRRRHFRHQTALQRAVTRAVSAAGVTKPATCHTLRHSFATHLVDPVHALPG